jgi:hypothetical protein
MVLVVAPAAMTVDVPIGYQEREKGNEKERRERKTKSNKRGLPCDETMDFLLVIFEHLQTPRTWPV